MFHFEPGPDRWKLGFKEAVSSNFKFLRRYGFHRVRTEATFVRYETVRFLSEKRLFVNVYHGRGSYEIGVQIGPINHGEQAVTVSEIVRAAGAEEIEGFGQHTMFQASSMKGVQEFVPKLAQLVRKYGEPFLRGDVGAFESAMENSRRASARHLREMELGRAREKVDAAWHARDYEQVARLLEAFEENLTRSEGMRLKYARKQVLRPTAVKS
ncbi:MAG: hypothetical protein ACLQVL_13450 [Terriglobia bacterium]